MFTILWQPAHTPGRHTNNTKTCHQIISFQAMQAHGSQIQSKCQADVKALISGY